MSEHTKTRGLHSRLQYLAAVVAMAALLSLALACSQQPVSVPPRC